MIKVGYLNFYKNCPEFFIKNVLCLNSKNVCICDCKTIACDIIFISCYGKDYTFIGKPKIIYWTGENSNIFNSVKQHDISLTYKKTTDTNLYCPNWIYHLDRFYTNYKTDRKFVYNNKKKFCAFIVSNTNIGDLTKTRNELFEQLSKYKMVDSMGTALNNCDFILTQNFNEAAKIVSDYKFVLAIENSTNNNEDYITEKILNAFAYNTVPIYIGCNNIEKYFNNKAFINGNNKTINDIVETIKLYDTHDELYFNMLSEYPFYTYENKDIKFKESLKTFYEKNGIIF